MMDGSPHTSQSQFWVVFEEKVRGLCDMVDCLELEQQMRAAHHLEEQVVKLLGDVKHRLTSEVKQEPIGSAIVQEITPVVRKRGRPRKTPVAVTKQPSLPLVVTCKQNASDIDSYENEARNDEDSAPEFDPDDIKSEGFELSSPTTTRRGRMTKKRNIFDPSDVEFDTPKPEAKISEVTSTTSGSLRKRVTRESLEEGHDAMRDKVKTDPDPRAKQKTVRKRGRPRKTAEAKVTALVNQVSSEKDAPDLNERQAYDEDNAASHTTDNSRAGLSNVDTTHSDDASANTNTDGGENWVIHEGVSDKVTATQVKRKRKKHTWQEDVQTDEDKLFEPLEQEEFEVAQKKGRRKKAGKDKNTVMALTESLRLKPGVVRRGRPRISDYEFNETQTVIKIMHKCERCEKNFSSSTALRNHQAMHDPQRKITCDDCGKSFFTRTGMYTHRRKHHIEDDSLFKCGRCVFTSRSEESLQYHYRMRHDENRPKNYVCHLCGKAFHKALTLENHVQGVHVRDKKYQCDQCEFVTHFAGCLVSHKRAKHNPDRKRHRCELCGSLLATKSEYRLHMDRHAGIKRFTCPQPNCTAAFVSKSQLATHRRCKHETKKFECPVCQKKFSDKHKVNRHVIVHTGEKGFRCPFCPYKCNVQANLRKHCKNVHQETYPPHTHLRVNDRKVDQEKTKTPDDKPDLTSQELPVAKHMIAMAMNEVGAGAEQVFFDTGSTDAPVSATPVEFSAVQTGSPVDSTASYQLSKVTTEGNVDAVISHDTLSSSAQSAENINGAGAVAVEYMGEDGHTFTQLKAPHESAEDGSDITKLASTDTAYVDTDGVTSQVREHVVSGGIPTRVGNHVVMLQADEAVMTTGEEDGTHQLILPAMSEEDLVLVVETEYC